MELSRALVLDYASAGLEESDRRMLDYAIKLTRRPGAMDAEDAERLRRAGFEDAAILDICQVTAYYAYVNRLADGLGVELEEGWGPEDLTVNRDELRSRREGVHDRDRGIPEAP